MFAAASVVAGVLVLPGLASADTAVPGTPSGSDLIKIASATLNGDGSVTVTVGGAWTFFNMSGSSCQGSHQPSYGVVWGDQYTSSGASSSGPAVNAYELDESDLGPGSHGTSNGLVEYVGNTGNDPSDTSTATPFSTSIPCGEGSDDGSGNLTGFWGAQDTAGNSATSGDGNVEFNTGTDALVGAAGYTYTYPSIADLPPDGICIVVYDPQPANEGLSQIGTYGTHSSWLGIDGSYTYDSTTYNDGSSPNNDNSLEDENPTQEQWSSEYCTSTPLTLTTQQSASDSGSGTITLGQSVTDTATVAGNVTGGHPDGTVDFFLCGPTSTSSSDVVPAACSSIATTEGSTTLPGTSTTETATSNSVTPSSAGTYCFAAVYLPSAGSDYGFASDATETADANECFFVASPALTLAKTDSLKPSSKYTTVGQDVTYTYTLTNSGNVTLSAPYAVSDNKVSSVSCPSSPATIAPNATVNCTATYAITQADLDNGTLTNQASATAKFNSTTVTSNNANDTITATQSPALALVKSGSVGTYSSPGSIVTYSYKVTNTGNVTLSVVVVTDPMSGLSAVSCPSATLALGATQTCSASYTVTQADLDGGNLQNTGTATGTPPSGPKVSSSSSLTITATTKPDVKVVKSSSPVSGSAVTPGETITYTLTATNTGDVTLHNVRISDSVPNGTTYVDSSATCDTATDCTADGVAKTVTFSLTSMPVGSAQRRLTFKVTVAGTAVGLVVSNTALYPDLSGACSGPLCRTNTVTNPVVSSLNAVTGAASGHGKAAIVYAQVLPPASTVTDASSTHTGEPWAGSGPWELLLLGLGAITLSLGALLRRRRATS